MSRRINAPFLMLASPLALALSLASREAHATTVTVDAGGACTMFEANVTIHNIALLSNPPPPQPGCSVSGLTEPGFKISVAAGTNHQLPSSINVSIALTIEGAGRSSTVLNSTGRAFHVNHPSRNPTLTLRNLTVRGVQAGTGILVVTGIGANAGPAHLVLTNVRVTNHISGIIVASEINGDNADATVQQSIVDTNLQTGITSTNSSVTILNSTIRDNDDSGIRASLTDDDVGIDVANSVIQDNFTFNSGGGIAMEGESLEPQLTILDSTIQRNQASGDGGGMWLKAKADVQRTNILSNTAQNGAGVYIDGQGESSSQAFVDACLFASNVAADIGGGFFSTGQEDINNSTFHDNRARRGGGIFHDGQEIHLRHNTFAANRASDQGGGVIVDTHSNPVVFANIVATNLATNAHPDFVFTDGIPGGIQTPSRNLIGTLAQSMLSAFPASSFNLVNPTGGPRLGTLQNLGGPTNVLPLLSGSPAIDHVPTSLSDHDQRGVGRPLDGNDAAPNDPREGFDIGAFEAPDNIAFFANPSASSQSMASRSAAMAKDKDPGTRWESGTNGSGTLTMTFANSTISSVTLREFGSRISAYRVEQLVGATWSTLVTGTTIGNTPRIHNFGRRNLVGMRVVVTAANGLPSLSEFEIY